MSRRKKWRSRQKIEKCSPPYSKILDPPMAGSRKTIINKIAYLIKYANLASFRICALNFTNKAANEMKERIVMDFLLHLFYHY